MDRKPRLKMSGNRWHGIGRYNNKAFIFVSIIAIFLSFTEVLAGSVEYTITRIGTNYCFATDFNNNGIVVGFIRPADVILNAYGFRWSQESGIENLGGYEALGINDSGIIVGETSWGKAGIYVNNSWQFLNAQSVEAINNKGEIIGLLCAQGWCKPLPYRGYLAHDYRNPILEELTKDSNIFIADAFGMNQLGNVVGDGSSIDTNNGGSLFYSSTLGYIALNNNGTKRTRSYCINDSQQIAGGGNFTPWEPTLWASPTSPITRLGSLGGGDGEAKDINNAGTVVGFSNGRAFRWRREQGMVDLNTLINATPGLLLTDAIAINEDGAILSHGKINNDTIVSFLLTPGAATTISAGKTMGGEMMKITRNFSIVHTSQSIELHISSIENAVFSAAVFSTNGIILFKRTVPSCGVVSIPKCSFRRGCYFARIANVAKGFLIE
jgi:probable HAF family extracellular repeat protein